MRKFILRIASLLLIITTAAACKTQKDIQKTEPSQPILVDPVVSSPLSIELEPEVYLSAENYNKREVYITMRDGVRLFTQIYSPKDISASNRYPMIMQRTCYSVRPYGESEFREKVGPNEKMMKEGYIVVYQDVRGRWKSEGDYDNMRPIVANRQGNNDIDESTDTYDTVEWLIANVEHNNGRVGQWGISYPGFYATNATIAAHPAMKAVSPQAPIGDFYFDDFHHNGAYTLSYWTVNNLFGIQKEGARTEAWYEFPDMKTPDVYDFFLRHTPLSKLDEAYPTENFFWEQIKAHPDYDKFWQDRGIIQHLTNDIRPAVMTVGGWYDAEDLYGPLMTYKTIEENNDNYNTIVMGPWSHGDWARKSGRQAVSNVYFGDNINEDYQNNVESTFFHHFLKGSGNGDTGLPEALMFDSGKKVWNEFVKWPPSNVLQSKLYLQANGGLDTVVKNSTIGPTTFTSDPKKPVPFRMDIKPMFIPRKYMADDQRQFSRRPDVLVFESNVLEEELTLAGPITANLFVSTTGTDSDWVVKIIDVYPGDYKDTEETQDHIAMGGYQQLVRGEVFRGRYRNGFESSVAFTPNKVEEVSWDIQDVHHTFKKGHKMMVHIQSSWFPYVDMNPQTFVPNIFLAKETDYQKQEHSLYHGIGKSSNITVTYLTK